MNNQWLEILEYARQHDIHIADFIEISISSRKHKRARRIEELLERLEPTDTLIVTELSRLGRSTGEVISLIDELVANDITIIVIKQNLTLNKDQNDIQSITVITMLSLFQYMRQIRTLGRFHAASEFVQLINCLYFPQVLLSYPAMAHRNPEPLRHESGRLVQ